MLIAPTANARSEADLRALADGDGRVAEDARELVLVIVSSEEVVPFRRMAFRWKGDVTRKRFVPKREVYGREKDETPQLAESKRGAMEIESRNVVRTVKPATVSLDDSLLLITPTPPSPHVL